MQGNDLSNAMTMRYFVLADVVFTKITEPEDRQKRGWFKTLFYYKAYWIPDLTALSKLWRWSANQGIRLELVFIGDLVKEAIPLWDSLDKGANPFSDFLLFEERAFLLGQLGYRPDLLGVVDLPMHVGIYGGKGLSLEQIP